MSWTEEGEFFRYDGNEIFVPSQHFAREAIEAGGIPEKHVYDMIQKYARAGGIALDIGANIGFHMLTLSRVVAHGMVYAVEADIDNVECLNKTIKRNSITNTSVLSMAASDKSGVMNILSSDKSNTVFSPIAMKSSKVAVCARLDDCIDERVGFIKLDIEGAEILALLGMPRILLSRPTRLMEFSPGYIENNLGTDRSGELLNLIFGLGYRCIYVSPDGNEHALLDQAAVMEKREYAFHQLNWGHIELLCIAD